MVPLRTEGGQRRYTAENISILEEIIRLKKMGRSLPQIKTELNQRQEGELPNAFKIELLANRIAVLAKSEISHFLAKEFVKVK